MDGMGCRDIKKPAESRAASMPDRKRGGGGGGLRDGGGENTANGAEDKQ